MVINAKSSVDCNVWTTMKSPLLSQSLWLSSQSLWPVNWTNSEGTNDRGNIQYPKYSSSALCPQPYARLKTTPNVLATATGSILCHRHCVRLRNNIVLNSELTQDIWYKQWKVRDGCLEIFAVGNSGESSDFPEGRSPKGKSDDPREFPGANFSDNPWGLSTVFQTFGLKQWRWWGPVQTCP